MPPSPLQGQPYELTPCVWREVDAREESKEATIPLWRGKVPGPANGTESSALIGVAGSLEQGGKKYSKSGFGLVKGKF